MPGRGVAGIVGWSLAAATSIILVVLFGVPLAADRLAPLVPQSFERRLGDASAGQVNVMFGAKTCDQPAGQAAFIKLVDQVPQFTEHMVTDIMPILATLDRVGPDLHELLDVTKDLRQAIDGIPGFSFLKRRGESKEDE